MQVRCFSTTSTLLKSITPHKTTGVLYSDLERLALTLSADLFQVLFGCLLGDLCAYKNLMVLPNLNLSRVQFIAVIFCTYFLLHLIIVGLFPVSWNDMIKDISVTLIACGFIL
jgi:hypothetical protein